MTEAIQIPTPLKASKARKGSNFGDYVCHITASVPDPCRAGQNCSELVAKVFGGIKDKPEVADAFAAQIATAVNCHAEFVKLFIDIEMLMRVNAQMTDGMPMHKAVKAALAKAGVK